MPSGQIKTQDPAARILVMTSFGTDDKVFPALKAGALGYLLKDSNPQELIEAIRQVQQGESWLHPAVARKVLNELMHTTEPASSDLLTEREIEVLKLVAHGLSNRDIADQLVISEPTVRTHVSSLLAKLHLASRTQAALYALRGRIDIIRAGERGVEKTSIYTFVVEDRKNAVFLL